MDTVDSRQLRELMQAMAAGTYLGETRLPDSECSATEFDIKPCVPSGHHFDMVQRMNIKLGPVYHPYLEQRWGCEYRMPARITPKPGPLYIDVVTGIKPEPETETEAVVDDLVVAETCRRGDPVKLEKCRHGDKKRRQCAFVGKQRGRKRRSVS